MDGYDWGIHICACMIKDYIRTKRRHLPAPNKEHDSAGPGAQTRRRCSVWMHVSLREKKVACTYKAVPVASPFVRKSSLLLIRRMRRMLRLWPTSSRIVFIVLARTQDPNHPGPCLSRARFSGTDRGADRGAVCTPLAATPTMYVLRTRYVDNQSNTGIAPPVPSPRDTAHRIATCCGCLGNAK